MPCPPSGHCDHCYACFVGRRHQLGPVEDDRATGLDRQDAPAHLGDRADRLRPDRRQVEPQVLRRLARLHHDDVAVHELAGATDRGVRALDALDRHHGAETDDDALPDVELADHLRGAEAEADVVPLRVGRRARREHAGSGNDVAQVERRLDDFDAFAEQLVGERTQQQVVAYRAEPRDHGERARVGDELAEELRLGDPADHDRTRDAGAGERRDQRVDLAGRDPGDAVHDLGERLGRLATMRDRDDLDAALARRLGEQHGKRPLPAMSPMRSMRLPTHFPLGCGHEGQQARHFRHAAQLGLDVLAGDPPRLAGVGTGDGTRASGRGCSPPGGRDA